MQSHSLERSFGKQQGDGALVPCQDQGEKFPHGDGEPLKIVVFSAPSHPCTKWEVPVCSWSTRAACATQLRADPPFFSLLVSIWYQEQAEFAKQMKWSLGINQSGSLPPSAVEVLVLDESSASRFLGWVWVVSQSGCANGEGPYLQSKHSAPTYARPLSSSTNFTEQFWVTSGLHVIKF